MSPRVGVAPSETPVALFAPLTGVQRIEASAGTGKTWTLSGLVLRLVVERGLSIEQVLAVTFTRAATAELRDRVRARLQAFLHDLAGATAGDPFCKAVAARCTNPEMARLRADTALRCFDDAPIFTIHGYCQRVLSVNTFACGLRYRLELTEDVTGVREEIVQDWWRREILGNPDRLDPAAHEAYLRWIVLHGGSPARVEKLVREALAFKEPRIRRPAAAGGAPRMEDVERAYAALRATWRSARDEVCKKLESTSLNQTTHPLAKVAERMAAVDAYLGEGAEVLDPPECLAKFVPGALLAATKKKGTTPAHPFFEQAGTLLEALARTTGNFAERWLEQRLRLVETAPATLRTQLVAQRLQTYDDLLRNLRDALAGPGGPALAATLRRQYPAALIDEFQDTDPVQYEVFRRIYLETPDPEVALFLIGDPKQAIYAFRGADVYAYLRAAEAIPEHHALTENQRSVPGLVAAVNALFTQAPKPFLVDGIGYIAVAASAREKAPLVDDGAHDVSPLRFLVCDGGDGGGVRNKGDADAWAVAATAAEIARLLCGAADHTVMLGQRPLRGGDIAVLVDAHKRGAALRDALAGLGIGSASQSQESVFDSREAEQLERLLLAIAEPQRESVVRLALSTELLGDTAEAFLAYGATRAGDWERHLQQFRELRERWEKHGFMPMFRHLMLQRKMAERLAAHVDGARRMTNLFHLAERLHEQGEKLPGIEAQLQWFAAQRREAAGGEDAQLRLESDENLVQIVTIHASKGLEYPVTFLPFAYRDRAFVKKGDELIAYHDPADHFRAVLDFDRSDPASIAFPQARKEELAESLRLLYVSLTRAKNRCYVGWGRVNGAKDSALAWLLHAQADGSVALPGTDALLRAGLDALGARSEGAVAIAPVPEARPLPPSTAAVAVPHARELARPVPSASYYTSFSSLQARAHEDPAASAAQDRPDHDQGRDAEPVVETLPVPPGGGRFAFPRGAAAGECLHEVFEAIDFRAAPSAWHGDVVRALDGAGHSRTWAPDLEAWIGECCATDLGADGGAFRLADFAPSTILREIEFHLPLADAEFSRLPAIARRHGVDVPDLATGRIRGFLKGYIDLVLEHRGRCYVADYKSNWLGPGAADYGRDAVDAAMRRGGYHLQYLLYTVAIVRMLRRRRRDFSYARDVGGVRYLFVRGMHPEWRSGGVPMGVFAACPPEALIAEIDALLAPASAPEPVIA